MRIGVPAGIKSGEFRVGLVPASVRELCTAGHEVHVQSGAGAPIGFGDAQYAAAGACIVPAASRCARPGISGAYSHAAGGQRAHRGSRLRRRAAYLGAGAEQRHPALPAPLADKGWRQALRDDPGFAAGLNVCAGQIAHAAVAQALGKSWKAPLVLIAA